MIKSYKFYFLFLGTILIIMFYGAANAAPICPAPSEVTQPDGSIITVRNYGDEFFSWKEDGNGNIIAYDAETNSYKYAEIEDGKIVPTSQTVGEFFLFSVFPNKIQREDIIPLWESAERVDYSQQIKSNDIQLMSADNETVNNKPLTNQKLLTILIEFNDVEIEYGAEFWSEQVFDKTPGALSVVNYWKENSNGLDIFEPFDTSNVEVGRTGTVSYEDYSEIDYEITECSDGVVKVSLDMPHPIKTWDEKDGTETTKTVALALKAIEQDFDFTLEQPHIVAMFAGFEITVGQGEGQGQVGAHTSVGGIETSDGINLGCYAVVGEKLYDNIPIGIGSICHELGHSVFSLPDLYMSILPNGGYEANGIAVYSLMSLGSWGSRYDSTVAEPDYGDPYADYWGHVPTHLDSWSKIKLGYATTTLVNNEWNGNINSISDMGIDSSYNVLEIRSKADPTQYFLIENRQLIGFDKGLEKLNDNFSGKTKFNGGIIIYHIDEKVSFMNNNNSTYHGFMQIERSTNEEGASSWPYLNIEGRNKFNVETVPNSNLHEPIGWDNCEKFKDCHPQTVESGISVKVLGESSSSMRVMAAVDDEYVIGRPKTKFSDIFPDENFCGVVIEMLEKDDGESRNPDDIISIRDWVEISAAEDIDLENRGIKDLTGIEYLSSLFAVDVSGNELTELDFSECPKLDTIVCDNNKLTKIDVSKCENLLYLSCNNNMLTEINVSDCKELLQIECENNLLTELDTSSNEKLNTVYCSDNRLTKLDFSYNPCLWLLRCYDNYMDNEPYNSIIGLEAVSGELGEPTSKDNEGNGWFVYYPQGQKNMEYAIKFVNDSGQIIKTIIVSEGEIPSYNGEIPTKQQDDKYKYTFIGWDREFANAEEDAVYTAQFTAMPRMYTVTLDTNNGTIHSDKITNYIYGTGATLPTEITRDHYTFAGWYDNMEFTGEETKKISSEDTGDKIFYAKWVENTLLSKYLNVLDPFKDRLTIERVTGEEDGLVILPKTDVTLPNLILYLAVYNADQSLNSVTSIKYTEEDGSIKIPILKPKVKNGENYKLILWDDKQAPVITPISDETDFFS